MTKWTTTERSDGVALLKDVDVDIFQSDLFYIKHFHGCVKIKRPVHCDCRLGVNDMNQRELEAKELNQLEENASQKTNK